MKKSITKERPKVGDTIEVRGNLYRIVKVYPFGTVDVTADGEKFYRVTGLNFL